MLDSNKFEFYKDNFNIYNLVTKINPYYKLIFDKINKCFLIINTANFNEICLKFHSFNANILKNLSETRIENSYKLFNYIDEYNNILLEKNKNNASKKLSDSMLNLFAYSTRVNSITKNDINKILKGHYV